MPKPVLSTATRPALRSARPDLVTARAIDRTPAPDPLAEVPYGGTMEADVAAETSALLDAFRARAAAEDARFRVATDSEFWFAVGFHSREQKDAFLAALDWLSAGDKYLDGPALAARMGIDLPPVTLPARRPRTNNDWSTRARGRG